MKKIFYEGLKVVQVNSLEEFYKNGHMPVKNLPDGKYFQNENLVLKELTARKTALAIIKNDKAVRITEACTFGITAKNKEQHFALNMLLDPSIQAVTLTGPAGTGKTLLAIAAGLEQVFGRGADYRKIIYVKSIQPVGKDIGFLPGGYEEKCDPFMNAMYDCLDICKSTKKMDELIGWSDKDKIQKMPASFVRGRTFRRSYIIVDEAQNFTTHELKTILTRLDDECKIVILGDTEQSDIKLKDEDQGLIKVVEAFKDDKEFGHINLVKSERSRLAQLVAEKLS